MKLSNLQNAKTVIKNNFLYYYIIYNYNIIMSISSKGQGPSANPTPITGHDFFRSFAGREEYAIFGVFANMISTTQELEVHVQKT